MYVHVNPELSDVMWSVSSHITAMILVILDPFRIYIGYRGNLMCSVRSKIFLYYLQVPHLLLFLALTLIPFICATIVLISNVRFETFNKSFGFHVSLLVFLICELILAIPLFLKVVKYSSIRFYLEKEVRFKSFFSLL